jgi:hypothetical protein
MRIDQTHRPWISFAIGALAVSAVVYIAINVTSSSGWSGGSAIGLTFGILGYGAMLFEGLLGWRKKKPLMRVGRTSTWMRGHIWLGLLSLPLILFHGGFAFRGPLTLVMMILFFAVWLSGIVGAVLQHYLPSRITREIPLETIYEEIPHVREQLRQEAEVAVAAVAELEVEHDDKTRFRDTFASIILPYLADPEDSKSELAVEARAEQAFVGLRRHMPAELHSTLDVLEDICEENRQFTRQAKLYKTLHTWLLVHVPLSIALLVLGGVHAVMALRY